VNEKKSMFTSFIQQISLESGKEAENEEEVHDSFNRNITLDISALQARSQHIEKNKISDKFNRRDQRFYELYCMK
jgi:hypothetical protein